MTEQFDAHPGNYLAFFSSFEYLGDQAASGLAARRPDIPQWRQDRRMSAVERQLFLDCFRPDGQGVGFAVLGGVFAEGVDLPGSLLIGAFVATLGLPPVSVAQDQMRLRMEKMFGADLGYADRGAGDGRRVVQAAGRVLRTPQDKGWLWLMDDRYLRPDGAGLAAILVGYCSRSGAGRNTALKTSGRPDYCTRFSLNWAIRPPSMGVGQFQRAAHALQGLVDDGQAQAGARGGGTRQITAEERFGELADLLWVHAGAMVSHGDDDPGPAAREGDQHIGQAGYLGCGRSGVRFRRGSGTLAQLDLIGQDAHVNRHAGS